MKFRNSIFMKICGEQFNNYLPLAYQWQHLKLQVLFYCHVDKQKTKFAIIFPPNQHCTTLLYLTVYMEFVLTPTGLGSCLQKLITLKIWISDSKFKPKYNPNFSQWWTASKLIEKIPLILAITFINNFKKIRRIWMIFYFILKVKTQIILTLIITENKIYILSAFHQWKGKRK